MAPRMPDEHGKDPPRAPAVCLLRRILAALGAGLALWLSWTAWSIREEDRKDEERMSHLQTYALLSEEDPARADAPPAPGDAFETPDASACAEAPAAFSSSGLLPAQAARVDFDAVRKEAPDTRAWIRIPGTNIHYPIVQARDNSFYLTHGPDGAESRSGAIFLSAACGADFQDPNTILYGHRMNSGTMFAQLHSFKDKAFLEEHPYIYISMPNGAVRTYAVFCVQKVPADDAEPAYRTSFADLPDVKKWIERERSGVLSARRLPVSVSTPPKVLTLSTCFRGKEDVRLCVQACFLREDRP